MSPTTSIARRAAFGVTGLALGGLTAVAEMFFVVVLTPLHAIPPVRPAVRAAGAWLVRANRRRLVRFLSFDDPSTGLPSWPRVQSYLVRRFIVASIGSGILLLIGIGLTTALIMLRQIVVSEPVGGGGQGEGNTPAEIAAIGVMGLVLFFGAVWGLIGVAVLERRLAAHYLGRSEEELLRTRVTELATSRAGVVEAVNDERRRIERDLHDGVQQRLVALGMLLGRARRATDPARTEDLLRQAHEESQQALHDLREVTWRVYPTALDAGGLHTALEGVADRSIVPVRLHYDVPERLDLATETVAYFVASEAVTNALKHGAPTGIEIAVTQADAGVTVTVRDNGPGGANATGSGLSGLASRVAAADGRFSVTSPPGGPTIIRAWLPTAVGALV